MRLLFLVLLAFSAAALAAPAARIVVRPSAVVAEREVRLGAIATIEGEEETARKLAALVVARTPRPGYTESLAVAELKRRVRNSFPAIRDRIEWSGAKAVSIESASSAWDGSRVQALAVQHARAWLAARYERFEVRGAGDPVDLLLPPGEVALVPRELPAHGAPLARMQVWIDVNVDGVFHRAVMVPVAAQVFGTALIARSDLAAGREARAADFETQSIELTQVSGAVVPPGTRLEGQRFRRALPAGAVLLEESLQPRPAVLRGDTVTLQLKSELLQVEARAVALADAAVGERLWVKRDPAGEPVRVEVVSPGIVEVTSK